MKYKDSAEQIEYLQGRVKGLELALKDLLNLLAESADIGAVSQSIRYQKRFDRFDDPEFLADSQRFDLIEAFRKLDVGHVIHASRVELALEECWHFLAPKKNQDQDFLNE